MASTTVSLHCEQGENIEIEVVVRENRGWVSFACGNNEMTIFVDDLAQMEALAQDFLEKVRARMC